MLEAALAYVHLTSLLGWVVFIASSTALTREDWLNAAALTRLSRVDRLAGVFAMAVLFSGLARMFWGVKGTAWYAAQPLLWAKLALWLLMVVAGVSASLRIQAWQRASAAGAGLPAAAEVAAVRRRLITASHLLLVIPLLAVCLVRGIGVR